MNKDVKCALLWASAVAAWMGFYAMRVWEGNFGNWSSALLGLAISVSALPKTPRQ